MQRGGASRPPLRPRRIVATASAAAPRADGPVRIAPPGQVEQVAGMADRFLSELYAVAGADVCLIPRRSLCGRVYGGHPPVVFLAVVFLA